MARSVVWPFRRTARGGLARTPEDAHQEELRQLIVLAHLPGPGNNPWDILEGVGAPDTVYGVGGGPRVARLITYSRTWFRNLENRARGRLLPGYPRLEYLIDGRAVVTIQYEDLETGQQARVEVSK